MLNRILTLAFIFGVSFGLVGCSAIQVPSYVKDTNPYIYTLYEPYHEVLPATQQALEDNGWKLQSTADPSIFEQNKVTYDPTVEQIVLISEVKDIPLFLGTRHARVNVFLTSTDQQTTNMEIRYLTVNSILFGQFENYKHGIATEHLYNDIKKILNN